MMRKIPRPRWASIRPMVPALIVIVAMRARFVFSPITTDEGGYFGVARAWARGAVLYRDVWVDRPQGLLVVYRFFDAIGLGSPEGIRILAIAACMIAAVACGDIAATVAGARARWIAALMAGALLSVPQYEGFIANAELLSCAAGAVSLALILRSSWDRERPHLRVLIAAGMVFAVALSMKQSGFDAFLAGYAAVVISWVHSKWSLRTTITATLALALGAVVPIVAMMIHGAMTGWHRWWYAVAGYRLEQRSALAGADWGRFRETARIVAPVLVPSLAIIVVLSVALLAARRIHPRTVALLASWCTLSAAAFAMGGQFHRHYWIIVMPPIATALGVVISRTDRLWSRLLLTTALLVAPAVMTVDASRTPRKLMGLELSADSRLSVNEHVAEWFGNTRRHDDSIYALCASAGLYGLVASDPPYPYLWFDGVRQIPGAVDQLVRLLSGPTAPRFVVEFQSAERCDPSGNIRRALDSSYAQVTTIDGRRVFELTTPGRQASP